jgi:hypothetical protein
LIANSLKPAHSSGLGHRGAGQLNALQGKLGGGELAPQAASLLGLGDLQRDEKLSDRGAAISGVSPFSNQQRRKKYVHNFYFG